VIEPLSSTRPRSSLLLFAALRGIIDANRNQNGRFLLLGSANPSLIRGISESLAGRVGILDLDPLTPLEVLTAPPQIDRTQVWMKGGFPDALKGDFRTWWESCLRTYVERDLPAIGASPEPVVFRRLLTMLAHQQGGLLNLSQLGNSLGLSHHTVRRYLDILEQTWLARSLRPYFRSVGKRLIRLHRTRPGGPRADDMRHGSQRTRRKAGMHRIIRRIIQ